MNEVLLLRLFAWIHVNGRRVNKNVFVQLGFSDFDPILKSSIPKISLVDFFNLLNSNFTLPTKIQILAESDFEKIFESEVKGR